MIEEGRCCPKTVFNVDKKWLFGGKMPKKTFIAWEKKTFLGFKVLKDKLTPLHREMQLEIAKDGDPNLLFMESTSS